MRTLEKNITAKPKSNLSSVFFQPKLTINPPDDQYEREADLVAGQIMRMPMDNNYFFHPASISSVQRKCTECEEEEKLQRKENSKSEVNVDNTLENYIGNINSGGNSLPDNVRSFFEPGFGYDFSNVRIHNDAAAAKSAKSINALAYTYGNNIVFNENQYSPDTDSGKRLLAHELTHVVQQNSSKGIQRKTYLESEGITDETTIDKESKVRKVILDLLNLNSSALYPYVKNKIKAIEAKLNKEFKFNTSVFGYHFKKLNKISDSSVKESEVHKTTGGFVDPATNDIYLHDRSNYCHALHEALHVASHHKGLKSTFGIDIMEGMTQYFTDIVFKEQTGKECKTHNYASQLKCAVNAVTLLGGFANSAEIFFNGKFNIIGDIAKSKSVDGSEIVKKIKKC